MFNDEVKSYADLQRVIDAGKPAVVVEKFAAMYLKSLDPRRPVVAAWQPVQDTVARFERITTPIVEEYTDEEGDAHTVTRYEGRELDEHEQAQYDAALIKRERLEDGYATDAVLDDEGNEVEPAFFTEGNAWLKTLRGEESDPVPEWEPMDTAAFLASSFPEYQKTKGVEFDGVLCSATAEDMWGLSSVRAWVEAGNEVSFKFQNGNTLRLTPDNLADFEAVWVPFRAGFFE